MNKLTAPPRCPLDLDAINPILDFPRWWQRAAQLVELPLSQRHLDVSGSGLAQLLKRLQTLDTPHRALLLTMACLANPQHAKWLQDEIGLSVGQLTATDLGHDVFQVMVGLLATFHTSTNN